MAYQFERFLEGAVTFILLSILAVIFAFILWKFWKKLSSNNLPSGPAAFGRGFGVIFPATPMFLYLLWYLSKFLYLFGLDIALTNFNFVICTLVPLVAGYASTRSHEQAGFFSPALLSGSAIIPYALLMLFISKNVAVDVQYKWLPIILFIPFIFIGALISRTNTDNAAKGRILD